MFVQEEAELLSALNRDRKNGATPGAESTETAVTEAASGAAKASVSSADEGAMSTRLVAVYQRLQEIDADGGWYVACADPPHLSTLAWTFDLAVMAVDTTGSDTRFAISPPPTSSIVYQLQFLVLANPHLPHSMSPRAEYCVVLSFPSDTPRAVSCSF